MKALLATLLCLGSFTLAYAEKPETLVHANVSSMGSYPIAGLGLRYQRGYFGVDLSGGVWITPLPEMITAPIIRAKFQPLYFPFKKGLYVGAGVGVFGDIEMHSNSISGEATIGYQWRVGQKGHKMFLEANGIAPMRRYENSPRVWPGVTLGIGF